MIERVAKAICIADDFDWVSRISSDETAYRQDKYMRIARAAIEAMREPTEKMVFSADWIENGTMDAYRAMIDAALNK